jgi:hypothetical protein
LIFQADCGFNNVFRDLHYSIVEFHKPEVGL